MLAPDVRATLADDIKFEVESRTGHHTATELSARIPYWDSMFTYGFLRNPWDRLVSVCCHALGYTPDKPPLSVSTFNKWLLSGNRPTMVAIDGPEQMLGNVVDLAMPCMQWLKGVTFIGRYEQLTEALRYICEVTEIEFKEPEQVGVSPRERDYRSYYTERTIGLVAAMYHEDIKKGGYTFE